MRLAALVVSLALAVAANVADANLDGSVPSLETITLSWTAPGDDGLFGIATGFDLRMSSDPLTAANFADAARIGWCPEPGTPGSTTQVTLSGLLPGRVYYFALKTRDDAGNWSAISNVLAVNLGAAGSPAPPQAIAFLAPAPNPARASTTFAFQLPEARAIRVEIYDLAGRRVKTLAAGPRPAGVGRLTWDLADDRGRPVPSGVYFARADLGGVALARRVLVRR